MVPWAGLASDMVPWAGLASDMVPWAGLDYWTSFSYTLIRFFPYLNKKIYSAITLI